MRSDLESNRGRGLTLIATKLGTFKRKLTGDITLSPESTNNLLDPNGADRIVNLPAVATGVFMVISNTAAAGTNFNLVIKNNAGTTVVILSPQDSTWLVGNDNTFYAVAGLNSVFGPSGPNHKVGLVPDPGAVAGSTRVLKEDGTWGTFAAVANDSYAHITNGTITTNASGLDTFKIRSSSGKIGITVQENDVTHGDNADFTVVEGAVDHNALLNYVANKHIDHSAVSISAGEGLSGGGDLTISRTLALAFTALVAATPVLGDTLAFYDQSATAHRKMLVSELNSVLAHDSLSGFVASKHIDHSLVFMIAGAGLSGGGDITATRTLSLDINSLTAQATMGANDYLAFYDVGGADHNKLTLTQLAASLTGIGFGGGGGGGGTPGGANTQIQFNDAGAFGGDVDFTWDKTNNVLGFGVSGVAINANGSERMRIDGNGFVNIGNGGALVGLDGAANSRFQLSSPSTNYAQSVLTTGLTASAAPLALNKTRGATGATHVAVQANDTLGQIVFGGSDGTNYLQTASIRVNATGTIALGSIPSFMMLSVGSTNYGWTDVVGIDSVGVSIPAFGTFAITGGLFPKFQVLTNTSFNWHTQFLQIGNNAFGTSIIFNKTRASFGTGVTIVQNGDEISSFRFFGTDGVASQAAARINVNVDAAPAANSMPGRITFETTPSGTTSTVERMRIDSAGYVLVNTTSPFIGAYKSRFNVGADGFNDWGIGLVGTGAHKFHPALVFAKTRGATTTAQTAVVVGDQLGIFDFLGSDGTQQYTGAWISVEVDAAVSLNHMPTRIMFATTASADTAPTERMRIKNDGNINIGLTPSVTPAYALNEVPLSVAGPGGAAAIGISRWQVGGGGAKLYLGKAHSATVGTYTAVAADEGLGSVTFVGADGSSFVEAAQILGECDATPTAGVVPGRITFQTRAVGGGATVERMRIDKDGTITNGGAYQSTQWTFRPSFQINTAGNELNFAFHRYSNDSGGPWGAFVKSRGVTVGDKVSAIQDDELMLIHASAIGSDLNVYAGVRLYAKVDGSTAAFAMPGRFEIHTTPAADNVPRERLRVDNAGAVIIGGHGATTIEGSGSWLEVTQTNLTRWTIGLHHYVNDQWGPTLVSYKSRGATVGTNAAVVDGDRIFAHYYLAADGTNQNETAAIKVEIDGTVGLFQTPGRISFWTAQTATLNERMRINSTGQVTIGSINRTSGRFQVHGNTFATCSIENARWSNDSGGAWHGLYKSRGAIGTHAVVQNGDQLGGLDFYGSDGTAFQEAAQIVAFVDVAPAGGAVPGRLAFYTTAGAGFVQVERMRIASYGGVGIGSGAQTTGYFHVAAPGVTNSAVAGGNQAGIEIFAYDTGSGGLSVNHYLNLVNYSVDGYGDAMNIKYSRGNAGAAAIVQNGDSLGFIAFWGGAGAGQGFVRAADISSVVDGTPGVNDMPGRLVFRTTPDGSGSLVERVRIDSAGVSWLMNGTTKQASVNETAALYNHEALGGI